MLERRRLPCRLRMAYAAILREEIRRMIRCQRAGIVALVALVTVLIRQLVIAVHVACLALRL